MLCLGRKVGGHSRVGRPLDITFALGCGATIAITIVTDVVISIMITIAVAFTTTIAIAVAANIVLAMTIGELKHATFLSHGRQPEVCCFLLNLSSHYPICIVKFLFTSRDH